MRCCSSANQFEQKNNFDQRYTTSAVFYQVYGLYERLKPLAKPAITPITNSFVMPSMLNKENKHPMIAPATSPGAARAPIPSVKTATSIAATIPPMNPPTIQVTISLVTGSFPLGSMRLTGSSFAYRYGFADGFESFCVHLPKRS